MALWGCRSQASSPPTSSQVSVKQTVSRRIQPAGRENSVLIRLAARGGTPRLYRLPDLVEVPEAIRGRLPLLEGAVGVDPEAAYLYVRTTKGELIALDLESGRVDTVATAVERATLGPDGTLYSVDGKGRVISVARRARLAWPQPLGGVPRDVFGATDQRLVAIVVQDRPRLIIAAADQPPSARTLALGGDVGATRWGDLLAVASDTGVTLLSTVGSREPAFVPLPDHPRAVVFSPSGHRLYVAQRTAPGLAVIDRFAHQEIDGVALPGPASTIRLDPFGRWLLARPTMGDTAWIVDLPIKSLRGALATSWRGDLPTVAPDGSLLLRQGQDIVAYRPDSLRETGRVTGGAGDLWIATRWTPRGGYRGAMAALPQAATDSAGPEGPLYVQVSVSQNQGWSEEMAQQLSRAGLAARVLAPPAGSDEGYRVVLGPYPTRTQAEAIGRKLGRPFWIYQPTTPIRPAPTPQTQSPTQ